MIKRPNTLPWLYRWSRPLLAAIATLGMVLTIYLTTIKLTGNAAVCPIQGCEQVLNSVYASIFGVPLSLFGAIAYFSMILLAIAPLVLRLDSKKITEQISQWTWLLLLAGGVAMTIFSSYLMYLLAFKIQLPCTYCIASAIFSLALLLVTLNGKEWQDLGQVWFTALVVALITLVATLGIFAQIEKQIPAENIAQNNAQNEGLISAPTGVPAKGIGWEITTTSGAAEIALAKHLTEIGAKEYIAWWCPHCHEQKMIFGKAAYAKINHIECDPAGNDNPQPKLCQAANISGFPTWEIKGQQYPGQRSLEDLAQISDFTGDRNFRYRFAPRLKQ